MTGRITDIQRFSIHDGPGIRTSVFLQGCNLRCAWCHNPEAIPSRPLLQQTPSRCIGCSACVAACPQHARRLTEAGPEVDRTRCVVCGACAAVCYADAIVIVGREVTVEEVMKEVRADVPFYATSGGGMTLTGGEPLMQPAFARALLEAARAEGISTAIETNLSYPTERLAGLLPLLDLLIADVKTADEALHREWCGAPLGPVTANLEWLAGTLALPIIIRTPIIPGVNDTAEAVGAIAELLRGLPTLQYYELLPFHPLGSGKYRALGMEDPAEGMERPTAETMAALAEAAREKGIEVRVG